MSAPQFVVYTIVDSNQPNGNAFWQRVGSAWSNKDGSLNITLNALPVNGRLHVRVPNAKNEEPQQDGTPDNVGEDITF